MLRLKRTRKPIVTTKPIYTFSTAKPKPLKDQVLYCLDHNKALLIIPAKRLYGGKDFQYTLKKARKYHSCRLGFKDVSKKHVQELLAQLVPTSYPIAIKKKKKL